MEKLTYREPGAGAVAYAVDMIDRIDLSEMNNRNDALAIMHAIMTQMPEDKRVKRCIYCGYVYRDDSLRNSKKRCSDECKTGIKSLQKRMQRADKALITGKVRKATKREINYVDWLEYPFWLDEYEMLKHSWKHEVSHEIETLDFIDARNQIYGVGNRKIEVRSVI